jgi:hypothetical protein
VQVGSKHRVALQTMTTTDTRNVQATVDQVRGASMLPLLPSAALRRAGMAPLACATLSMAYAPAMLCWGRAARSPASWAACRWTIAPTPTQVKKCADAGADIVRITVQGKKEAEACMRIREQLFKDK